MNPSHIRVPTHITERELADPWEGVLFAPVRGSDVGVHVLAGSSGRIERERARNLAQQGFTALAIRWFGGRGQSPGICEVPLETFTAAVHRSGRHTRGVVVGDHPKFRHEHHDPTEGSRSR